jgi:hypothetical protein
MSINAAESSLIVCHCALLHQTDLGCKWDPGFSKQRTRQDLRKRGIKNGYPLYSMIRADGGGGGITVVVSGVKVCERAFPADFCC